MRVPVTIMIRAESMSKELHLPFKDVLDILMRVDSKSPVQRYTRLPVHKAGVLV
jgi:hypothetical protein